LATTHSLASRLSAVNGEPGAKELIVSDQIVLLCQTNWMLGNNTQVIQTNLITLIPA